MIAISKKNRTNEAFYRVVLEASDVPTVILETERGCIAGLNSKAADLLGGQVDALTGHTLAQFFEDRHRDEFLEALQDAASARDFSSVQGIIRHGGQAMSVLAEFFRAADGLYLLCRILPTGLEFRNENNSQLFLGALFANIPDAIVLIDAQGKIRDANEAFLSLTDMARLRDVSYRPLSDFLIRGSIDLNLILQTVAHTGRLARYMTQTIGAIREPRTVEISAACLGETSDGVGVGLVIRETAVSYRSDEKKSISALSEDAMRDLMDLVGTASLKDLVGATSDVVEKMCIETALKLTGDNRAAAAEMLSLSRQSLYIKLRKHGLIGDGHGVS